VDPIEPHRWPPLKSLTVQLPYQDARVCARVGGVY
jgi:hypothetical protein